MQLPKSPAGIQGLDELTGVRGENTVLRLRLAQLEEALRALGQVIGVAVQTCFAPGGHDTLSGLLANQRGTGGVAKRGAEPDLLTGTGLRVPALLSVSRLQVDGLPDAICMVATDLTRQKWGDAAFQARQTLLNVIEGQRLTEENLNQTVTALRLRDNALGAISQGVLISDARRCTTYVNQAWQEISGYTSAEMAGRSCAMLQGPGTDPEALTGLRQALDAALPFHGELLNYRKDGSAFWNELSVTPVFDAEGALTQFVGVMRDVSVRRQADAQLLLSAKVFEQSSEGFMITDARRNIVKVNPAFTAICGFTEIEALGHNPRMLSSGRHDAAFYQAMWAEIGSRGRWQGEVWNRRRDGTVYPQWMSTTRVTDASGQVTHYIASFSDITLRKEAEAKIQRLAHFDPLTGLPNRALLGDRATQALRIALRNNEPAALMFIDLDHFKHVNDSLGHAVGDRLLVALAARFKEALRDQDTLSRIGGDEFVLLLPDTDAPAAAHVADKLLQLSQQPYQIDQHELSITPSIGIAIYPLDGPDFDALAKSADAAMYRAKQGGRNAFCF